MVITLISIALIILFNLINNVKYNENKSYKNYKCNQIIIKIFKI